MKRIIFSLGVVSTAIVAWWLMPGTTESTQSNPHSNAKPSLSEASKVSPQPEVPHFIAERHLKANEGPSQDDYVQQLIVLIKQEFGDQIRQIAVQAKLKEFRDDLIKNYPRQGEAMFRQVIEAAFPDHASSIFQVMALLDEYEAWLLAHMPELNRMDLAQQQEFIWSKRYELFGEDAPMIWEQNLSPQDERERAIAQSIAMLDQAEDLSIEDKLYRLQAAFDEAYADTATQFLVDTSSVKSQVFFRFDSVQQELAGMEPAQRQERINDFRRQMGFDDQQIARMAARDQKREQRWQNGYAYMEARRKLEQSASTEGEFDTRVSALREEYFGNEARTIMKEEEELGFFRYERPRIYGWN